MAKKLSASSQPAGLVTMTSEDIKNRTWTREEILALRHAAERQAAGDDSDINFEDIPRLTEEQLSQMVRFRDLKRKVPVSVRLDPEVLTWLKSELTCHELISGPPSGSWLVKKKK